MNANNWVIRDDIEVISNKIVSMRVVRTYAPSRKSCPHCKFDGVRHKGGKKWEKFYYVINKGDPVKPNEKTRSSFFEDLVFICRKCNTTLQKGIT